MKRSVPTAFLALSLGACASAPAPAPAPELVLDRTYDGGHVTCYKADYTPHTVRDGTKGYPIINGVGFVSEQDYVPIPDPGEFYLLANCTLTNSAGQDQVLMITQPTTDKSTVFLVYQ